MLINVMLVICNAVIVIAGYFIIKNRIEKKLINQGVLNKIKEEINAIIIQLNDTTLNNVSIIEEKIKELDKKIILADKKSLMLKIAPEKKEHVVKKSANPGNLTYSPKNIIKQTQKMTENQTTTIMESENIDEKIKKLSDVDKVRYLIQMGVSPEQIMKKTGLSTGELELLMNMSNLT